MSFSRLELVSFKENHSFLLEHLFFCSILISKNSAVISVRFYCFSFNYSNIRVTYQREVETYLPFIDD